MQKIQIWALGQEDPSGGRNDNLLQYSCQRNSMNRGTWTVIVHRVSKSQKRLSDWVHEHNIHQIRSVAQSCLTPWNPMKHSMPGLPVHHQLAEFTHTHVHQVSDDIQPSHPLASPSPFTFKLSQHQSVFQWVGSLYQVAKVLEHQVQHQSFQWMFKTNFLYDWLAWSPAVQGPLKSLQ